MYALLLEKLQIELKYFCEPFYIIYDYVSKVALNEFMNVFLLFFPISICICMYIAALMLY